jgi:REP element-mobilizing transposase RayT
MARKARLHVPGGVYHVILRGNGGQDVFFADADRSAFYRLLAEGSERFATRVHGFCLMTNHVHLLLQVGEAPLSGPMQNLSFRYTRWVNWHQGRHGHVFQGRCKALLVDAENYLLELVRYLHLNPVRAGLVRDPQAHPWSSHRAYLGLERLDWLTTDWVLGRFGRRAGAARAAYGAFMEAGRGAPRRAEFHRGAVDQRVLGDEHFVEQVLGPAAVPGQPPKPERIIARVAADFGLDEAELAAPSRRRDAAEARAVIGYLARSSGSASLSALARRFGRDVTTLSRAVGRMEHRVREDAAVAARLEALNNAITQA